MNTWNSRLDRLWETTTKLIYEKMAPEMNKMIRQSLKDGEGALSFRIKPNGKIGAKAIKAKRIYKKREGEGK